MAGSNAWQQEDGKSVTSFIWNDSPYAISQGFGENSPNVPDSWYAYSADYGLNEGDHAGIDIAMPRGTPISAPEEGDILQSGDSPYFRPDPVWLKTSDGRVIILGHLWSDTVKAGDHVAKGQLVGYSGEQTIAGTRTPDGSGPHLHLEERQPLSNADGQGIVGYKVIDPMNLILGTPAADNPSTNSGGGGMLGNIKLPSVFGAWGPIGTLLVLGGAVVATVAAVHLAGNL